MNIYFFKLLNGDDLLCQMPDETEEEAAKDYITVSSPIHFTTNICIDDPEGTPEYLLFPWVPFCAPGSTIQIKRSAILAQMNVSEVVQQKYLNTVAESPEAFELETGERELCTHRWNGGKASEGSGTKRRKRDDSTDQEHESHRKKS
jgi:hypothetical protein